MWRERRLRPGLLLLAALAVAAAAPFDGYVRPAVIYRDFLVGDVAGLLLIAAALRPAQRRLDPARGWAAALVVAAGLVTTFLLSFAHAPSAAGLVQVLRLGYLVALLAVIPLVVPARWLPVMLTVVTAGTVIRFAMEAVPFFTSPDFVIAPYFQFGSFTSNPNTLGGFGSAVFGATLGLALAGRGGRRFVFAGLAIVLGAGIVLSFSKGAWIASAAGALTCVVCALPTLSRRSVNIGVVAAALALAVAAATPIRSIPELMIQRWTSYGSVLSNAERLRYVFAAARIVRAHPVLGAGIGDFRDAFRVTERAVLGPDDPHDVYLAVASEAGIPALTLYGLLLAAVLLAAGRATWTPDANVRVRAGVVGALVALGVFGLVSSEPLSARTAWVLMGCALIGRPSAAEPMDG
jgi:O-antigen ligase